MQIEDFTIKDMAYRITDNCNGCEACRRLCPVNAITGGKGTIHVVVSDLCIECGGCGRVCPVAAVKDPFGISCATVKRSLWDKPRFDEDTCMSCRICIDACPVACLSLSGTSPPDCHGHPYMANDKSCIGCGFCSRECPVGAIKMEVRKEQRQGKVLAKQAELKLL